MSDKQENYGVKKGEIMLIIMYTCETISFVELVRNP